MDRELWDALDGFVAERLLPHDEALEQALADSDAAGLPPIALTAPQGKLLELLARMQRARSILELGTLGGYSTIWLARALPADGRLVTLELNPEYAAVARANIARAGLDGLVQVLVGPALDTLPDLHASGAGPFDLVFVDADKQSYPAYFAWALKLSRPGTVIVCDNVVRAGSILAPAEAGDGGVAAGARGLYDALAAEPGVSATAIQTVGAKGHDGFVLALVEGDPAAGGH